MKFDLFPSPSRSITLGLFLLSAPLRAADWPHWLGPNSDNTGDVLCLSIP